MLLLYPFGHKASPLAKHWYERKSPRVGSLSVERPLMDWPDCVLGHIWVNDFANDLSSLASIGSRKGLLPWQTYSAKLIALGEIVINNMNNMFKS